MANVLSELFGNIAEAIRSKTGDEGKMKPIEFPEKIRAISGGGGSADVRYVTFMSYDGSEEYGKLPVAVGYDCPNPKFDTPTRESDVQYNYTFAGWATTPNGGLDADALKAVDEDRIVYANFAAVLRTYLITFLDADGTKLTEKTVAYGSIPSYTPTKNGYDFVGWNPAPVEVTGAASYTAVWKLKASFTTATWAQIAEICAAGQAAETFAVGDYKPVTLTYTDGTSETINFRIVDMNADTDADGTAVPITLLADNLVKNSVVPGSSNSKTNQDILDSDKMKTFISTIEAALPTDLMAVIKPVKKFALLGSGTQRKVFIPSRQNLDGTTTSSNDDHYYHFPRKQYAYFAAGNTLARTKLNDATACTYWVNTLCRKGSGSTPYYYHYIWDGTQITSVKNGDNTDSHGVLLGFCI